MPGYGVHARQVERVEERPVRGLGAGFCEAGVPVLLEGVAPAIQQRLRQGVVRDLIVCPFLLTTYQCRPGRRLPPGAAAMPGVE